MVVKVWDEQYAEVDTVYATATKKLSQLEQLIHPNIARWLDAGIDGGRIFIISEYIRGESLRSRMIDEAPSLLRAQKLRIVEQIADALAVAHERGVVHGDLWPGSIQLTDANDVKLTGFVIAALVSPADRITPTRYTSPEYRLQHVTQPADDVYALACITYELFAGKYPENTRGAGTVVFPPPLTSALNTAQYAAIVRALEPDRIRRTSTAREFQREWRAASCPPRSYYHALWLVLVAIVCAATIYIAQTESKRKLLVRIASPPMTPLIAPTPAMPIAGTALRDCEVCPSLIILPPGGFEQGSKVIDTTTSSTEKPEHWISIGKAFALADETVTVQQYEAFVHATGRHTEGCEIYDGAWRLSAKADWRQPGFKQTGLNPVVCVSWNDAVAYTEWLSKTTGYYYRLPSAAEWEYAARGTPNAVTLKDSDERECDVANVADKSASHRYPGWTVFNCNDGFVATSPVSHFVANGYGLHDMLGNVLAWTLDCWHGNYIGAPTDGSPRTETNCSEHELRGASWFSAPAIVRASYRNHFASDYRGSSVGIRVVRELAP